MSIGGRIWPPFFIVIVHNNNGSYELYGVSM